MNRLSWPKNERGIMLISIYAFSIVVLTISGATYTRAVLESKQIEREISKLQSHAAAEGGLQYALAQIADADTAYSGFINTDSATDVEVSDTEGTTFSFTIDYPNEADWAVVSATGSGANSASTELEGRVFLDSDFSKYMRYVNAAPNAITFGDNLVLGSSDGTNPEGVSSDAEERAQFYYSSEININSSVHVYGDLHIGNSTDTGYIDSNGSSSQVHGDTYIWDYASDGSGVTNDGVDGTLTVSDGFSDGADRNGDGVVSSSDYPDHHDLNASGGGDSHAQVSIGALDLDFYSTVAADTDNVDVYRFSGTATRYLKLEAGASGTTTKVTEYTSSAYTTVASTYTLAKANGIIYSEGDIYVKGDIEGRLTVASGDDIRFVGNVNYAKTSGDVHYVDSSHAAAFLAQNKLYLDPTSLYVSGILYAEKDYYTNNNRSLTAIDAGSGSKTLLRLYGNAIYNGGINTSIYADRQSLYDSNTQYYRPPGLPIRPDLRTVREA